MSATERSYYKRRSLLVLFVTATLVTALSATPALANQDVSEVVSLDPDAGEFPEGLAVDAAGNVYFGLAPTGEIRRLTPAGEVSTFAQLPPAPEGAFGTLGLVPCTCQDARALYKQANFT